MFVPAVVPALVLLVVVVLEFRLYWRARVLALEDDTSAFEHLRDRFRRDIVARAKRGDGPDWPRYMDDVDRIHESRSDRLRVWATAALVIGIGGTMFALALHLLFIGAHLVAEQEPGARANDRSLEPLLSAMGSALIASLAGVLNNLTISLSLLPGTDKRFAEALANFKGGLQDVSAKHPPHETFAEAVKSQLGDAFREAVQKFPEAFERLDENVQSLAAEIERQSTSVHSAATGLRESADGLAAAAAGIAPAAAELAASTKQLSAMPDQLKNTLDATRAAWKREMQHDRSAFVEGVREILADQQTLLERTKDAFEAWEDNRRVEAQAADARLRELATTVRELPASFGAEVEKVSANQARQFGVEVRSQIQDLVQKIAEVNEALRTQVASTAEKLQALLEGTGAAIEEWENARRSEGQEATARQREFMTTVNDLPSTFAAEVEKVSATLGRHFGVEARNHVQDLVQKIGQGNEALRTQVEGAARELQTVFLNNTSDVVARTLERVYSRVESTLLKSLDEVGKGLREALTELPNNAKSFADSLSDADGKLQRALDDIKSASHQLASAAKFTDDFEGTLTRALTRAAAEEVQKSHAEINSMIESLIAFIRNLVDRLAQQRDRTDKP